LHLIVAEPTPPTMLAKFKNNLKGWPLIACITLVDVCE
jgi:hypothetical protein